MRASVTRSIAAERNGTESSIPAMFVLRDASDGSILLAAGRISTSSKVNPSLMILTPMLNCTFPAHFRNRLVVAALVYKSRSGLINKCGLFAALHLSDADPQMIANDSCGF